MSLLFQFKEFYYDKILLNLCHCQKELTDYIKKKRRFVLVAVTSIFVVTTIIMVMSVIHVEMNQTIVGYEECCMPLYPLFVWIIILIGVGLL